MPRPLGYGIRNPPRRLAGNEKLLASCRRGQPIHPDDCSMMIIEAAWELLQEGYAAGPTRSVSN
jgi:hypothetical protein